ncbi:hypothetical protein HOI26_05390 [Candidatus Woesearchaeota archaeon]|jgi:plastocyanin|nr:hypothetical protein [Candidatus Woesearchaeota archaeon]MBT5740501.1 hypothetical protein [Candidatus Woesearchaeota archaeon]
MIFLLCMPLVSASMFFPHYDTSVYSAPLVFSSSVVFSDMGSYAGEAVIVSITPEGFFPREIIVNPGDSVVWRNDRRYWESSVIGVRDLHMMQSEILSPGETFLWTFNEPGEYTYVDVIVLGYTGRIIVQQTS